MVQTTAPAPSTRAPALLSVLGTLARNDARLFGRDSFLPFLGLVSIGLAVLVRLGLPWVADFFAANPGLGISPTELFPLFIGYVVIFEAPLLGGVMIAFILLDERDDRTLEALLVTPVPTSYYLTYRLLVAIALGAFLLLVNYYIVEQAMVPFWQLLPIVAVASLMGGLSELFLATFAADKVEGFAQVKIIGTSGLLLLAAWFVPMPWQLLFGLYPPYWGVKAYWLAQAGDPSWWLALLLGAVFMLASLAYLIRRFSRVVHG